MDQSYGGDDGFESYVERVSQMASRGVARGISDVIHRMQEGERGYEGL